MMMKRKSKKNTKRKNEFRYHVILVNKNGRMKEIKHPAYIWQQRGNIYDYFVITHSSNIEGVILIKLRRNPNPKDNKESFYDSKPKNDIKSRFGKKKKGWKLHPLDQQEMHGNKK